MTVSLSESSSNSCLFHVLIPYEAQEDCDISGVQQSSLEHRPTQRQVPDLHCCTHTHCHFLAHDRSILNRAPVSTQCTVTSPHILIELLFVLLVPAQLQSSQKPMLGRPHKWSLSASRFPSCNGSRWGKLGFLYSGE